MIMIMIIGSWTMYWKIMFIAMREFSRGVSWSPSYAMIGTSSRLFLWHIAGIQSLQIHSRKSFQSYPLHKNSTDVTLIGGDDRALKEVLKVLKARRAFNFKAKDIYRAELQLLRKLSFTSNCQSDLYLSQVSSSSLLFLLSFLAFLLILASL